MRLASAEADGAVRLWRGSDERGPSEFGRSDKDFQKLRAERASQADEDDDPNAPKPPEPLPAVETPEAKPPDSSTKR